MNKELQKTKENKMGVMPINRLIVSMSLPMIVSMLIQALYNVFDSYVVSLMPVVGVDAVTAISNAFPVQNLMIAVASGTAVGVNALLSRSLGEKDFDRANKVAENGVFLALVGYAVFLLFGLFGSRVYYGFVTENAFVAENGTAYMTICLTLSFGMFFQIMFERLMQSTGRTIYTMITQGTGAIINIVLDPIFVLDEFLGLPGLGLGVAGAAWATVIGQIVACVMAVIFNHHFNPDVHMRLRGFRPSGKLVGRIYAIGVPSVIMIAIGSIMYFSLVLILNRIDPGETGSAVFGIYYKLQSFVFMPVFGLNNGIIPIVAFNYGARNRDRMMKSVRTAAVYAMSIMALGVLLFQLFPDKLLGLFNTSGSESLISMGLPALRRISLCFVPAGLCIALGSVFQALGRSMLSLFVSVARQLLVLVPSAWLLSLTGDVAAVWWSFPIAELVSTAVSVVCFAYIYRGVIRYIPLHGDTGLTEPQSAAPVGE